MEPKSEVSNLKSMPLLQAVFHFTDNDLIANRYGQLTNSQTNRLHKVSRQQGVGYAILLTLGVGLVYGFSLMRNNSDEYSMIIMSIIMISMMLVFLIAYWLVLRSNYWVNRINKRPVQRVTGVAVLSSHTVATPLGSRFFLVNYDTTHILRIDDKKFFISSDMFNALENGAAYCVYYVNTNKSGIVAVEPISSEDYSLIYEPTPHAELTEADGLLKKKKFA